MVWVWLCRRFNGERGNRSSLPGRFVFKKNVPQHFALGYFQCVLPGRTSAIRFPAHTACRRPSTCGNPSALHDLQKSS
jgi:hypothetical protein